MHVDADFVLKILRQERSQYATYSQVGQALDKTIASIRKAMSDEELRIQREEPDRT